MFNKFAERYLCALYRMRQLKITPMLDNLSVVTGRYSRRNATNLDPLSFMLEGTQYFGNCYLDFAEEYAISPKAMLAFRVLLSGKKDSAFTCENPTLSKELQNFAYGVFHYMRENYGDSRYYLDMVDELAEKTKIKQLITNPSAFTLKKPITAAHLARKLILLADAEYNNRIW